MDTRIKAIKKGLLLLEYDAILYRARWNAAKEMYEILTGEKWVYYNL